MIQMKTTSNIKSEISLKPLVGPSQNFKLKLIWPNQTLHMIQMKTTFKVTYLSNHWWDLPQILNLILCDKIKLSNEDDLKY